VTIKSRGAQDDVIHGIRPTLETLSQWCSEEKMGDQKGKAIGFVA